VGSGCRTSAISGRPASRITACPSSNGAAGLRLIRLRNPDL
jgi:hypothetical protein